MAKLTLGLDLGPTSLGWALISESDQSLVSAGVRVFPEGVARDPSGAEVPKMAERRVARSMRRQLARRARRKRRLRSLLVSAGLLPPCANQPRFAPARVEWERESFREADPYSLRERARSSRLELVQLGRVLLHLAQRRGFKSNRKTDKARRKEQSELLAEIGALEAELGERTLGEYLASLRPSDARLHHTVRLRGKHTRREMYEREFEAIWGAQRAYHADVLTDELYNAVRREIFFQRNLLPPSPSLVGRCELEPRLPRCPRADRRAQRFRIFQEVNNLRVLEPSTRSERPLTAVERAKVIELLRTKKERTFDELRKKLFEQYEGVRFNLERGDRDKLKGLTTDAVLAHKELCGKSWHKLGEDIKDRIVAAIIDDNEERLRFLLAEAGLDVDRAEALLDANLDEGYASYSLSAIKRLLPHLEAGLPLTSREPSIPCALRAAGYLMPWEHPVERRPFLDDPPSVTNPLVRQALFEVKRVVNAILRELVYRPGHTLQAITIELAREVRGTPEQRRQYQKEINERRRERDKAADQIRELGYRPTRDAIDRYRLWQEQEERCLYSGRPIGVRQLLEGEADIDHILPYSRSLDDSFMNKVVAFRAENSAKGDRTVCEWLGATDPTKYEQILQRAARLPVPKVRRLQAESVQLDDFFARQLVDTTYITSRVHEYVRCLAPDVICVKGQHTAELRRHWGLNTILSELADGPAWREASDLPPGEKDRSDHRHHAIDAIVIALTTRSRLQQLASIRRAGGTQRTGEVLSEPWADFRASVRECVRHINVSHRVRRRVRGPLHEDTVYGPTDTPGTFVYRKPVELLTAAMVHDIRDPAVKSAIVQHLASAGVELSPGVKIPAEVWRTPPRLPSGVPIKRVRLLKRDESIRSIRAGTAYVKPGRTHHVCIFEVSRSGANAERDAVFVTLLEAYARLRSRQAVISRRHPDLHDARFLMSLSPGEIVLLRHGDRLEAYRFETGASTTKQMWFRHISFAGRSSDKRGRVSKNPNTLDAEKITIDPIGRVRRSRD